MKSPTDISSFAKTPSNPRNLRVGEEIRHAISDIFMRGELHSTGLLGVSITVSEVRVSPDLKNATAYIMPLAGENKDTILESVKEASPEIRHLVSKKVKLRYVPRIVFALDNSYEEAQRISNLLNKPDVVRDLKPNH